jgi:heptosyltransferase-2
MKTKILVIRFSSFGDVVQCMGALSVVKSLYPNSEIHWVTKGDFVSLLELHPDIEKVWSIQKGEGLLGLIKLGMKLNKEGYTLFYDAHLNLRSKVLKFILFPFWRVFFSLFNKKVVWISRSKSRLKRFLLFKFGVNLFERPFKGALSYQRPFLKLKKFPLNFQKREWNFNQKNILRVLPFLFDGKEPFTALAPSAAWEMKRWPLDYWKKVIELCPNKKFIILGGPGDHFCQELEDFAPERVRNLAGRLNLVESSFAVSRSETLISADTGLLHVADQMGKKTIALIGPTAFGYPSGPWVKVLEVELDCRPCTKDGRGYCKNKVYQSCLIQITPELVSQNII